MISYLILFHFFGYVKWKKLSKKPLAKYSHIIYNIQQKGDMVHSVERRNVYPAVSAACHCHILYIRTDKICLSAEHIISNQQFSNMLFTSLYFPQRKRKAIDPFNVLFTHYNQFPFFTQVTIYNQRPILHKLKNISHFLQAGPGGCGLNASLS